MDDVVTAGVKLPLQARKLGYLRHSFLIGIFLSACVAREGSPPNTVMASGMRSQDFTVTRVDGDGELRLASLRGRVVVLSLWAAWCDGCERDLPLLDAVASRLEGSGVTVLAVSLDSERTRVESIGRSRSWELLFCHDTLGRVGDLYLPAKMPAIYVIDRAGTVRYAHVGLRAKEIPVVEAEARRLSRPDD